MGVPKWGKYEKRVTMTGQKWGGESSYRCSSSKLSRVSSLPSITSPSSSPTFFFINIKSFLIIFIIFTIIALIFITFGYISFLDSYSYDREGNLKMASLFCKLGFMTILISTTPLGLLLIIKIITKKINLKIYEQFAENELLVMYLCYGIALVVFLIMSYKLSLVYFPSF